ncbi:hypothetical protein BM221_008202 [Beauveria bassiana]|uniref:Uncharacterized protein n=1 Tax=Beauveria bassiana TaxID=176275 RepID=A0A2N6NFH0_BEABA|nr:hypothetical protein BM221_008202 [Beauveria bassiana]
MTVFTCVFVNCASYVAPLDQDLHPGWAVSSSQFRGGVVDCTSQGTLQGTSQGPVEEAESHSYVVLYIFSRDGGPGQQWLV